MSLFAITDEPDNLSVSRRYPTQGQMILPLVEVLAEAGEASTVEVYGAVAARCGFAPSVRDELTLGGVRAFDRHVRWAEQAAGRKGFTEHKQRSRWAATDRGREFLRIAAPGVVTVVLRRPDGEAVWADAMPVLQGLAPESVDLYFTSPPYHLTRAKEYGSFESERAYINWLVPFAQEMHRTLRGTGSMVLNLGLGPYVHGSPTRSPLLHRLVLRLLDDLGFHLAGEHIWVNPAALPAPAEWVTKRRCQVKDGYELVFWFSKTEWPKADNRRVLVPYSESQRRLMARGHEAIYRPSGHDLTGDMGKDNGGAIPSRVLVAANTSSNDGYQRACRAQELPIHPARFPEALPDWWIRFLTEVGDQVVDPFAGSLTTAAVASRLGRRWLAIEQSGAYLEGGVARFTPALSAA